MGADVNKIKSRIKSVDSTLHLTKAMELVAASKIRRAKEKYANAASYKNAFEDVLQSISRSADFPVSSFMRRSTEHEQVRKEPKIKLIVIAGDRGLAGGYNANVFKLASTVKADEIITIGKRSNDKFGKNGSSCADFTPEYCLELSNRLLDEFLAGEYDELMLVSTEFISMMKQEARLTTLLPLTASISDDETSAVTETIFEPDPQTVFRAVLPEYLSSLLYSAVRESYLSEITSRRFAMDSACRNAEKMLDDLTLRFNRARQSAITQEITEIISGSAQ